MWYFTYFECFRISDSRSPKSDLKLTSYHFSFIRLHTLPQFNRKLDTPSQWLLLCYSMHIWSVIDFYHIIPLKSIVLNLQWGDSFNIILKASLWFWGEEQQQKLCHLALDVTRIIQALSVSDFLPHDQRNITTELFGLLWMFMIAYLFVPFPLRITFPLKQTLLYSCKHYRERIVRCCISYYFFC